MAVVSYNESKNGKNNSLIVHGNKEELKKVAEFVNGMYDKPVNDDDNDEGAADMVNEPPHYIHGMECIDEMVLVFGKEAVKNFCLCNAWKYRYRAPYKGDIEENMEKSRWYLNKYKELKDSVVITGSNIISNEPNNSIKPGVPALDITKPINTINRFDITNPYPNPYPNTDDKKVWCTTTTNKTNN